MQSRRATAISISVALAVLAVAAPSSLHFWLVDACVDAGGVLAAHSWACIEPRPEGYRALSDRPVSFWLLVFLPPLVLATVVALALHRRLGVKSAA